VRHATLALGFSLVAAGCGRGCARERPYTPYVIGSTAAPSARGAGDAQAPAPSDAFAHQSASVPDDAALRLEAPPGERLALVLAVDVSSDGTKDVVAWAVGSDPLAGRLLSYAGGPTGGIAAPRVIASLAPGTIGVPGCTADPRLERIGSQTVAISVHATCPFALDASVRNRWIAVASPARAPPLREEIRIGGTASGETLRVELDASDRDGDGRDDLSMQWTLEGAPLPFEPGPSVSALVRYYDRPAGLSRDPGEPEASLMKGMSAWAARAAKKADAVNAERAARSTERLHAMLCSDEGVSIVSLGSGDVRCGPSRALEDAVVARVRGALSMGDVPRAIAALARIDFRPATRHKKDEIQKWITKAAPPRTVAARTVAVEVDAAARGVPAWGPLAFAVGGDLVVRTRAGVVSIAMPSGAATKSDESAWPSAVTSPDGAERWLALYDACDGGPLRIRFGASSEPAALAPGAPGPLSREVLVPILAPAPTRCVPGGARHSLDAIPIGWGGALEAFVAGEPVTVSPGAAQVEPLASGAPLGQPWHLGSAASPDARALALATALGVLVRAAGRWQLLRPDDIEGAKGYAGLSGCTAGGDGRVVACVRTGRVLILDAAR
jgi:hypothetical protein